MASYLVQQYSCVSVAQTSLAFFLALPDFQCARGMVAPWPRSVVVPLLVFGAQLAWRMKCEVLRVLLGVPDLKVDNCKI